MAGNILLRYAAASTAVTVTNLHSLAASATWVAGWTSNSVTNASNVYEDYMVGATFTTHASNRQAGIVEMWIAASLNDTPTWFTPASGTIGTEGAVAFTAVEQKFSYCRLLTAFNVTATASQIYAVPQLSVAQLFGGVCPTHFAILVLGNAATTTAAQFAAAGSAVYYTPITHQYT